MLNVKMEDKRHTWQLQLPYRISGAENKLFKSVSREENCESNHKVSSVRMLSGLLKINIYCTLQPH